MRRRRSRRRRLAETTFKNENKVQLIKERAEEATVAELCERGVGEAEGMEGRRGQERRGGGAAPSPACCSSTAPADGRPASLPACLSACLPAC